MVGTRREKLAEVDVKKDAVVHKARAPPADVFKGRACDTKKRGGKVVDLTPITDALVNMGEWVELLEGKSISPGEIRGSGGFLDNAVSYNYFIHMATEERLHTLKSISWPAAKKKVAKRLVKGKKVVLGENEFERIHQFYDALKEMQTELLKRVKAHDYAGCMDIIKGKVTFEGRCRGADAGFPKDSSEYGKVSIAKDITYKDLIPMFSVMVHAVQGKAEARTDAWAKGQPFDEMNIVIQLPEVRVEHRSPHESIGEDLGTVE